MEIKVKAKTKSGEVIEVKNSKSEHKDGRTTLTFKPKEDSRAELDALRELVDGGDKE